MRSHPVSGLVLVVAIVTACGPAAVALSSVPPSASPVPPTATPRATPRATPPYRALSPEATIRVTKPVDLAIDGASMWVLSSTGEISVIDTAKNTSSAPTMVAPTWTWGGFGANAAALWLGDYDANLVYRIDPVSLAVVAEVPVAANPDGAGVTADAVWIAQHRGGSVTRIDPATNAAVTITVGNRGPGGPHEIGFGAGSVWVSAGNSITDGGIGGAIVRIDPATNRIQATIKLPVSASACGGFAIDDTAVWVNSCFDMPTLIRIDPATNTVVAAINLGGYSGRPVLINGVPWLMVKETDGGPDPARLVRIDPATNTIDLIVSLGDTFTGERLVVADGSLWATDWAHDRVLRFPLAVLAT